MAAVDEESLEDKTKGCFNLVVASKTSKTSKFL